MGNGTVSSINHHLVNDCGHSQEIKKDPPKEESKTILIIA
jgi:hypothetical protein